MKYFTVKDVLDYVDEVKANNFSRKTKIIWLNELEHRVQTEIMLIAADNVKTVPDDNNYELVTPAPWYEIYYDYLFMKLSEHLEESSEQNNRAVTFDKAYTRFMRWWANTYEPSKGNAEFKGYYVHGKDAVRGVDYWTAEDVQTIEAHAENFAKGIAPQFKGDYSVNATYQVNNIVQYQRSLYWHKGSEPTTGVNPTNTEVWQMVLENAEVPTLLSQLIADSTHRTVTDAEKADWNDKQDAILFSEKANGAIYQIDHKDIAATYDENADKISSTYAKKAELNSYAKSVDVPSALSQLSGDSSHRTVTDAEKARWNAGGGSGESFDIHELETENALANSDEMPFYDISASAPHKTTWSNIKAKLKAYFDTLYIGATSLVGYATQAWVQSQGYGTYTKPSGGIPKTDLASAVQTSLGKADTAVQPDEIGAVANEDVLPVSKGGTGATTAAQARINLGVQVDVLSSTVTTDANGIFEIGYVADMGIPICVWPVTPDGIYCILGMSKAKATAPAKWSCKVLNADGTAAANKAVSYYVYCLNDSMLEDN